VRLAASRDEAGAMKRDAIEALTALPLLATLDADLAEARNDVAGKRAALAEARGEAQALAREAELRHRRREAIAGERAQWRERVDGAQGQVGTVGAGMDEARRERAELDSAPAAFAEKRIALIGEIEAAEAVRRAAADALAAADASLAAAEAAEREARDALAQAREQAVRAEERHESSKRRLADVAPEIHELLDVLPEGVAELAGVAPGAELPELAAIEAEIEKLRRDRERLGAVNLRAEEELREVETQHASLTTERDDLVEAIKRLRQGIASLNREARERLTASF